ncbi:hypothetical protein CW732_08870 [Olleya sp. Bg11-27]|nr:hypothetical protein CW732_08870 [Olleya sp. Bg11-27]
MTKKIRNTIIVILGVLFVYSFISLTVSNSISKDYGVDFNEKRIELGIKPLTENWTLDSIALQPPIAGVMCFPSTWRTTSEYKFLEDKRYCQYWTNRNKDTSIPYHKSKIIYFTESYWIWKYEITLEYDTYINPNSELAEYEELEVSTHWWSKEIYGHLAHMKNGEDLLIDFEPNRSMYGFEKSKVDKILKQWNLK